MAWTPKVWVDRAVQFAGRRLLTPVAGVANTFDVTRADGTVFTVGDEPDAASLNDLEGRIGDAFDNIEDYLGWIDITSQCTWSSLLNTTAIGGINHYVKVNTKTRTVDVCGLFNAGRANGAAFITIPTTYVPSLTLYTPLGVTRYDVVKTMSVNYFIKPNGEMVGSHSVDTPTGMEENIHFTFTY